MGEVQACAKVLNSNLISEWLC